MKIYKISNIISLPSSIILFIYFIKDFLLPIIIIQKIYLFLMKIYTHYHKKNIYKT